MPYVFKESVRPKPWRQFRWRVRNPFAVPFLYIEWLCQWTAWFLSQWSLLEVLEYCGSLSILVGVIFYFAGTRDRREQRHYQAWQVINTAQGKSGNGGRLDALQDLNADDIPLVAVDLHGGAFLRNIDLPRANLLRADLSAADMRGANLREAILDDANMIFTNLRGGELSNAHLAEADLSDADLSGANLIGANFTRASLYRADLSNSNLLAADFTDAHLDAADLRNADLSKIANWKNIKAMTMTNIFNCKNAPDGFRDWALKAGAVEIANDDLWNQRIAATQPAR